MSKFIELSETIKFVNERIETKELNLKNYISTENMQPNKGGITNAIKLPPAKTTTRYKKEDILISNIRLYFEKIWIADRAGGTSSDILVLRNKKGYNSKFIYYALSDINFFNYADVTSKGTKMPRGDKKAILKYPIPNLNLKDQEKIADVLSTYDELIENNNRRIEILEKAAEEIYKEWFVRMRFPGHENTKFIKGIPEGWEVKKLINNENKLLGPGIDKFQKHKRYLATANVQGIDINGHELITFFDRPLRANMQPKKNTIWFAKMQDSIKHIYVGYYSRDVLENLVFSTGFAGIKCSEIYFYYYLSFIRYGVFENLKDMYANGSTQVAINNGNIKKIKILLPHSYILEKFNEIVKENFKLIYNYKEGNQNLIKQRDQLLPRLMNGTIEVK